MASFPAIRPPLREAWRAPEPDGVRRTAMDAGPPKGRVESTNPGAPETFEFRLDATDAATLRSFYRANKVGRFDLDHWIWGACEAEFMGPIEWGKRGPWTVAIVQLRVYT